MKHVQENEKPRRGKRGIRSIVYSDKGAKALKNVLHPPFELHVGNTLLREAGLPCIACCRSSIRFGSVHEPDTNDSAKEPANRGDEAECFAGLDTPCS